MPKSKSQNIPDRIELLVEPKAQGGATVTLSPMSIDVKGKVNSKSDDSSPSVSAAQAKSDGRGSERYARWDVPKLIFDKLATTPIAAAAIENKAHALLGQGIGYVRRSDLLLSTDGKAPRAYNPEIEAFISRSNIHDYLEGKAYDIASTYNGFTQHILSLSKTKIVQLKQLECEYSRVSKLNPSRGTIDRSLLYYSGEFSRVMNDSYLDDKEKTTILDLYNPFDLNWLPNILAKNKYTFATQSRIKTHRSFYYATPAHLGLYKERGWVDVAGNVPEVVYAMQTNQMSLKYIIYISVEYFEALVGKTKWLTITDKERQVLFETTRQSIQDKLVGTTNAFSSLTLMCDKDFQGNMRKTIEIVPVDDKAKTGTWVPDSDHANQEIVIGHNLPTSMFGLSNSNVKMNTQSGSADRQGFNTLVTLNTPTQRLLLSDLQLAANWNAANGYANWDVIFYIDDITHTTTNTQETGIQTPKTPPQNP